MLIMFPTPGNGDFYLQPGAVISVEPFAVTDGDPAACLIVLPHRTPVVVLGDIDLVISKINDGLTMYSDCIDAALCLRNAAAALLDVTEQEQMRPKQYSDDYLQCPDWDGEPMFPQYRDLYSAIFNFDDILSDDLRSQAGGDCDIAEFD